MSILYSESGNEVMYGYENFITNIHKDNAEELQRFKRVSDVSGVEIEIFDKAYARNGKGQPDLIAICWGNPNITIEDKEKFRHCLEMQSRNTNHKPEFP